MTGQKAPPRDAERLRRDAEALLDRHPESLTTPPSDLLELIHELRIYQAELEIQNEELISAHNEITDLKDQYETLYEFAPCGYLTLNPKGMITRINLTAVTLLGRPRAHMLRSGMSQFIAPTSLDGFIDARKAAAISGNKESIELLLNTATDLPVWIRADIEAVRDNDQRLLQWRMAFLDISKQRQAEVQRQVLADQLELTSKMQSLGTLAGGIAHEFNNLLAIIIGNIDLARESLRPESPAADYIAESMNASLRAKDVTRQLLTFTRMHAEAKHPLQLEDKLRSALKLVRATLPANITLQTDFHEDLHPVVADSTQIDQVIINLCSNAADAMSGVGGIIRVGLENRAIDEAAAERGAALRPGPHVELSVADTGQGIAPGIANRIFDPYFTTKAHGKGVGMGLAVVHGIVENHKGTIAVESRPGAGTTFTILFPRADVDMVEAGPAVTVAQPGCEKILFLDDEIALTRLYKQILEKLGYAVEAFHRPQEALERFAAAPGEFDLVITDMAMPGITGEQLTARLLNIREDIPVVLCTGYNQRVAPEKAERLGVRQILVKPVDHITMAGAIRRALDQAAPAS